MDLTTLTLSELTANITKNPVSKTAMIDGKTPRTTLRRCRTREQGTALLTVGHAIEYLVDSRLIKQETTTGAEREALAILLNANLTVYSEGAEIVPLMNRLRSWFHGGNTMKPKAA